RPAPTIGITAIKETARAVGLAPDPLCRRSASCIDAGEGESGSEDRSIPPAPTIALPASTKTRVQRDERNAQRPPGRVEVVAGALDERGEAVLARLRHAEAG